MSKLSKTIMAGISTGLCALGPCGLERKYKFSRRLADLARSIETAPFPGTRLYAFLASRLLRPLYATIADEIVDLRHYDRILDIGTGVGYLPIEIALRDPKANISGIDESQDMVKIASSNARASKVGKSVGFARANATSLPYPGRYFDLVISANILHQWSNPKDVFAAANHALAPGGEFWLCDYRDDIPADVWESIRAKLPFRCRVPFAVGPMASSVTAYGEAELLKMAAEAKFEVAVLEQRTFTLFGQPMPLFNILKLRKPLVPGEHAGRSRVQSPVVNASWR